MMSKSAEKYIELRKQNHNSIIGLYVFLAIVLLTFLFVLFI